MEIRSLCISPKHISNKLSTTFKKTKEKMKSKKFWKLDKKKVMAASAVLLIGAAVYLNYVFFLEDTKDTMTQNDIVYENSLATNSNTDPSNEVNYFTQAVMDRQKARDEALEVLQIVVENEDALASSKDSALQQMSKIAEDMQKESNIESLVVSKGFEECVREKEIIFEERKILTDDQMEKIDQRLRSLKNNDWITAKYFVVNPLDAEIGQYKEITGPVFFEKDPNIIRIRDRRILITDLAEITGDLFD